MSTTRTQTNQSAPQNTGAIQRQNTGANGGGKALEAAKGMSPAYEYLGHLQRAIGNDGVTALWNSGTLQRKLGIQPKMTVGAADDHQERHADIMAEHVMRMAAPAGEQMDDESTYVPADGNLQMQRKPLEIARMTGMQDPDEAQAKLIQRACAKCDEEAQAKYIQRETSEDEIQNKPIQRNLAGMDEDAKETLGYTHAFERSDKDEDLGNTTSMYFKAGDGGAGPVTADTETGINNLRDRGGSTLPDSERSFFEPRFGRDFGSVRIHTGPDAAQIARSINARAFTIGRDVVFGANEYRPGTTEGRRLMAHELTHTVQQGVGSGIVQRQTSPKEETLGEKIRRIVTENAEKAHELYNQLAEVVREYPESIGMINTALLTPARVVEATTEMNLNRMSWVDIGKIWLWELGGSKYDQLSFGRNARTTKALMMAQGVRDARKKAQTLAGRKQKGVITEKWSYNVKEFSQGVGTANLMTSLLGTYTSIITVEPQADSSAKIHFRVINNSGWDSATRLRKGSKEKPGEHRGIIPNKERGTGIRLGGTVKQEWTWSEHSNWGGYKTGDADGKNKHSMRTAAVSYLSCVPCNAFTDDGERAWNPPENEPGEGPTFRMKHSADLNLTTNDGITITSANANHTHTVGKTGYCGEYRAGHILDQRFKVERTKKIPTNIEGIRIRSVFRTQLEADLPPTLPGAPCGLIGRNQMVPPIYNEYYAELYADGTQRSYFGPSSPYPFHYLYQNRDLKKSKGKPVSPEVNLDKWQGLMGKMGGATFFKALRVACLSPTQPYTFLPICPSKCVENFSVPTSERAAKICAISMARLLAMDCPPVGDRASNKLCDTNRPENR